MFALEMILGGVLVPEPFGAEGAGVPAHGVPGQVNESQRLQRLGAYNSKDLNDDLSSSL